MGLLGFETSVLPESLAFISGDNQSRAEECPAAFPCS